MVFCRKPGEPIAVPCNCSVCRCTKKYVEVKQRFSRPIMSSVGSSSSTVEFLIAFSVQSRAS